MNCVFFSLLTEEREIEGLKRQKNDVVYLFVCFFFLVNWSYFIMGLLYWALFYSKFLWEKFLGLI
jgi:hypothetical protein